MDSNSEKMKDSSVDLPNGEVKVPNAKLYNKPQYAYLTKIHRNFYLHRIEKMFN